jgi:hypothetical protein
MEVIREVISRRRKKMDAIHATWKSGQIILDGPVDWPEGCRLVIEPETAGEQNGIREEDGANTPEAIATWLKWYASLEPLVFTPEEEADLAAWRQKIKEYTLANMHKGVEELFE